MVTALNERIFHFRGLAADFAKKSFPIPKDIIGNGSTYLTMDDGLLYIYDKANDQWLEYTLSGGGGGGGGEPAAYLKNATVDGTKLTLYKKNGTTLVYTPTDNNYTNDAKAKVDAIPADPKYTDTIYDDTAIKAAVAAKQDKLSNGTATEVVGNKVNVLVDGTTVKIDANGKLIAEAGTEVEKSDTNGNIKVDGDELVVYVLPKSYDDYLKEVTYAKPAIATFSVTRSQTDYEAGQTVSLNSIKHQETNIANIKSLTFAGQTITPASAKTEVTLTSAVTVSQTTTFTLSGINSNGASFSANDTVSFYKYAYSAISESDTAPQTGTKGQVIDDFENLGDTFTYAAEKYLYIYSTKADGVVQTGILGQWIESEFVKCGKVTNFVEACGATVSDYYAYRVGPFIEDGSAKYRVV